MEAHPAVSALGRLRQEALKLKISVGCTVSQKLAWDASKPRTPLGFRQGFSLCQELSVLIRLASETPGICLTLTVSLMTRDVEVGCHTCFLHGGWGSKPRCSCLHSKGFYQLNHLFSLAFRFMFKKMRCQFPGLISKMNCSEGPGSTP